MNLVPVNLSVADVHAMAGLSTDGDIQWVATYPRAKRTDSLAHFYRDGTELKSRGPACPTTRVLPFGRRGRQVPVLQSHHFRGPQIPANISGHPLIGRRFPVQLGLNIRSYAGQITKRAVGHRPAADLVGIDPGAHLPIGHRPG